MKKIALLLTVTMLASFVGCGTTETADTTSEATTATEAAEETTADEAEEVVATAGGTITFNSTSEPPEMNSIVTSSTGSGNVLRHIVDGLVMLDETDTPVPAVAESWDISEDGLTYTFHLRDDYTWSNGEAVTAHDFVFAWTQLFTAASGAPYGATWAALIDGATELLNAADDAAYDAALAEIGYTAVDDYTLEVTLTNPYPYFLSVCAFYNLYPINEIAYNEMGGLGTYATEASLICTNGQFTIDEWEHESQITLNKSETYPMADETMIDTIVFEMISDSSTSYNAFVAGEIDIMAATADQVTMASASGYNVEAYDDGSCWYFEYQTEVPGLNNANIRKAITYAIDADIFIESVIQNDSVVANSFTPPAINGGTFTETVGEIMDRETYKADDYAEAKALLALGLEEENMTLEDLDLVLICDDTDTAAKYAAFFQEQLLVNLGLTITVEQMTYNNRIERMENKDFSIVMAGWGPDYNDPMTFMDLWISGSGNNHTSYASAEYDALIAAAVVEADADARIAILIEAEELLMEDMPIGPIYNRKTNYLVADGVEGVVRTAFDDINFRWAYIAE
ncbi:MAG: peptide ABC transporter substrate-binding protein [Lachnospiraceae bacterium]